MSFFSGETFPLVFKRSIRDGIGAVSMNADMLNVLLELDGKKDLAAIRQALSLDTKTIGKNDPPFA